MNSQDEMTDTRYRVVANDEAQYSIWSEDQAIPAGWRDMGVGGSREECLRYIDRQWTDMRPLSARHDEHPAQ